MLRNPLSRAPVFRACGGELAQFYLARAIARNPIHAAPLNFASQKLARHRWERTMKYLLSALTALFLFAYFAPDANAVVCARGVYRAGCVGPRGGVVVRRGPRCFWRGGVRVCR
jgi:hypothetical protein